MEGVTVLAVLGGFGLLILSKLQKRNSPLLRKFKQWMSPKPKDESIKDEDTDHYQQIYTEKRTIM